MISVSTFDSALYVIVDSGLFLVGRCEMWTEMNQTKLCFEMFQVSFCTALSGIFITVKESFNNLELPGRQTWIQILAKWTEMRSIYLQAFHFQVDLFNHFFWFSFMIKFRHLPFLCCITCVVFSFKTGSSNRNLQQAFSKIGGSNHAHKQFLGLMHVIVHHPFKTRKVEGKMSSSLSVLSVWLIYIKVVCYKWL